MTASEIINMFKERGFKVHGRCKGKSGRCYIVASVRDVWDRGDKIRRSFNAVPINTPDFDWICYRFSISRTAVHRLSKFSADTEKYLNNEGLKRVKIFLLEDDTEGREQETMISSQTNDDEIFISDRAQLQNEISDIKYKVLYILLENRYSGVKRTSLQNIEDKICTFQSTLHPALKFLNEIKLITGLSNPSGIKITAKGELEFETMQERKDEEQHYSRQIHSSNEYDVFISHASEDKETFVRELATKLQNSGLKVWYDEFTLKIGDSLRNNIDIGLASSKRGIVVLSHHFFSKSWPQRELNALFSKMKDYDRKILPIWHNLSAEEVTQQSPLLSDIIAANSSEGIENVVKKIIEVCKDE